MKRKEMCRTLKLDCRVSSSNGDDSEGIVVTSKGKTTSKLPVPVKKCNRMMKPKRTLKPPAFDAFDIDEIIITRDERPTRPVISQRKREHRMPFNAFEPAERSFEIDTDEPKLPKYSPETKNPDPKPPVPKIRPLATSLKRVQRIEKPEKLSAEAKLDLVTSLFETPKKPLESNETFTFEDSRLDSIAEFVSEEQRVLEEERDKKENLIEKYLRESRRVVQKAKETETLLSPEIQTRLPSPKRIPTPPKLDYSDDESYFSLQQKRKVRTSPIRITKAPQMKAKTRYNWLDDSDSSSDKTVTECDDHSIRSINSYSSIARKPTMEREETNSVAQPMQRLMNKTRQLKAIEKNKSDTKSILLSYLNDKANHEPEEDVSDTLDLSYDRRFESSDVLATPRKEERPRLVVSPPCEYSRAAPVISPVIAEEFINEAKHEEARRSEHEMQESEDEIEEESLNEVEEFVNGVEESEDEIEEESLNQIVGFDNEVEEDEVEEQSPNEVEEFANGVEEDEVGVEEESLDQIVGFDNEVEDEDEVEEQSLNEVAEFANGVEDEVEVEEECLNEIRGLENAVEECATGMEEECENDSDSLKQEAGNGCGDMKAQNILKDNSPPGIRNMHLFRGAEEKSPRRRIISVAHLFPGCAINATPKALPEKPRKIHAAPISPILLTENRSTTSPVKSLDLPLDYSHDTIDEISLSFKNDSDSTDDNEQGTSIQTSFSKIIVPEEVNMMSLEDELNCSDSEEESEQVWTIVGGNEHEEELKEQMEKSSHENDQEPALEDELEEQTEKVLHEAEQGPIEIDAEKLEKQTEKASQENGQESALEEELAEQMSKIDDDEQDTTETDARGYQEPALEAELNEQTDKEEDEKYPLEKDAEPYSEPELGEELEAQMNKVEEDDEQDQTETDAEDDQELTPEEELVEQMKASLQNEQGPVERDSIHEETHVTDTNEDIMQLRTNEKQHDMEKGKEEQIEDASEIDTNALEQGHDDVCQSEDRACDSLLPVSDEDLLDSTLADDQISLADSDESCTVTTGKQTISPAKSEASLPTTEEYLETENFFHEEEESDFLLTPSQCTQETLIQLERELNNEVSLSSSSETPVTEEAEEDDEFLDNQVKTLLNTTCRLNADNIHESAKRIAVDLSNESRVLFILAKSRGLTLNERLDARLTVSKYNSSHLVVLVQAKDLQKVIGLYQVDELNHMFNRVWGNGEQTIDHYDVSRFLRYDHRARCLVDVRSKLLSAGVDAICL